MRIGASVDDSNVRGLLEQIAYEAAPPRALSAVPDVARQIAEEPVVVFEESPPVARALQQILAQGGAGYIVITGGHPFLLVAYEVVVFVVWFAAGPVKGARAGLEEAAHDAAREVGTEVFRDWFRRAFRRRPRR